MRKHLEALAADKTKVSINFNASGGAKLVSVNGIISEVFDDCLIVADMYGNTMLVPLAAIAYVEIKK
ncbi:MAG: hypothetical protein LBV15_00160 [Planctomycetota bacterium]|jgi:hypothetical protein|nr:hypothetical protein [Planctomycetota bacterium]